MEPPDSALTQPRTLVNQLAQIVVPQRHWKPLGGRVAAAAVLAITVIATTGGDDTPDGPRTSNATENPRPQHQCQESLAHR